MGQADRRRVLVAVEPALLGHLLAEILGAVGEDDVTDVSGQTRPAVAGPFSVALVSAPMTDAGGAEVVITLPAPGERGAEVHTKAGAVKVDVSGPLAVLNLLDRFCPASRGRAAALRRG